MYATRVFQLLFITFAIICMVKASNDGAQHNEALMARQTDDTSDSSATDELAPTSTPAEDTAATSSEPAPAPTSSAQDEETSSAAPETSSAPPPEDTSSAPAPSTTSENTDQTSSEPAPSSTSEDAVSSTAPADETSQVTSSAPAPTTSSATDDETTSSSEEEPVTSTAFSTITTTNESGATEVVTSAIATTTTEPDLNGDGSSSSSGLSPENTRIVIGVVVGVGGAIILGALGVVAWRIRNRKKLAEENDGLMDYDEAGKSEPGTAGSPPQSQAASARSPFQSTLDTYHQPTGPVNASSNF